MARPPEEPPFWGGVLTRLLAVFVAGLASLVLFRAVVQPILRGDAERVQKEHAPAELRAR